MHTSEVLAGSVVSLISTPLPYVPSTIVCCLLQSTSPPLSLSGGTYAQPFGRQLIECIRKTGAAYWRMPSYNLMRMITTAACGLIYGTLYYKLGQLPANGPATVGNVQNIMGVLFSGASFLGNINLMSVMPVFNTERVVSTWCLLKQVVDCAQTTNVVIAGASAMRGVAEIPICALA